MTSDQYYILNSKHKLFKKTQVNMYIYTCFFAFKGYTLRFGLFPLLKGIPLEIGLFFGFWRVYPLKVEKIPKSKGIPSKSGKKTQI